MAGGLSFDALMGEHMKRIMIAGLLLLSSCGSVTQQTIPYTLSEGEVSAIQNTVRSYLKDPSSATFKSMMAAQRQPGIVYVCGIVDSKNKGGAFTGGEPFAGVLRNTSATGRAAFSFTLTAQGSAQTNFNNMCRQNGVVS
ncbi:hypothetical protein AF71_00017680 [Rhizobium sp. 57MFTsu3.2]|nr:hypothetical protein [Rhizobium sp. 57MFTsu3.2]